MTVYEESDEYCPHCDNHYVSSAALSSSAPQISELSSGFLGG